MRCPSCGAEIADDSVFCTTCGARIDQFAENAKDAPEDSGDVKEAAVPDDSGETVVLPHTEQHEADEPAGKGEPAPADADSTAEMPNLMYDGLATDDEAKPVYKFCVNCGAQVPAADRFCPRCGNPTDEVVRAVRHRNVYERPPRRSSTNAGSAAAIAIALLVIAGAVTFLLHYYGMLGDPAALRFLPMREQATQADTAAQAETSDVAAAATTTAATTRGVSTYQVIEQAMSWEEAAQYCAAHGGRLAVADTQEAWQMIRSEISASDKSAIWLGASRSGDDWYWADGSQMTFSAWGSTEPNNEGGRETCLMAEKVSGGIVWFDEPEDVSGMYADYKVGFVMETGYES